MEKSELVIWLIKYHRHQQQNVSIPPASHFDATLYVFGVCDIIQE